MVDTSPPVVIPDQLKGRGLRFTRLRRPILGDKNSGKGPIDPDFYDDGALAEDDDSLLSYIKDGDGFGLVCNFGDLAAFDADEGEELEALGIMARLPPTLTDKAPNKPESLHLYYICPGLPKTFHFYHPTKTVEKAEKGEEGGEVKQLVRLELGQICAGRGHITGPGAPHWSGGRREIIDDSPLAEITVDDLRAILRGLAFSDDPTKNPTFETAAGLEEKAGRWDALEEITRKARRGRRGDGPSLSERIGDIRRVLDTYGWSPTTKSGDNWKGDIPGEVSKSKTALAVDIKKGVWYCHHHADSGGDAAALVALFEGLIDCRGKDHLRDRVVFQAVIKACEEKGLIDPDEDRGRGESSTEGARDFIETVKEGLIEDPRKLKDRAVLAALLTLREKDPLEFDFLADELKGAGVIKLPTLKKMIDGEERRQADEKAQEEEAGERLEIAPDVEREADQILSAGLAFEYLYETWQARHLGDAKVGKALLGGFGAQRCVSTSGIHIQINGPREAGKSHAVEEAVNLLPPRLVMMGSMSNMTLYYDAENMPAGAAVSIDDITYTETFGAVQKRCTTGFQSGATHRSVVDSKDGKVVKKFTTKPRMAFYTTCVDRQQDEQLRSRLWSIDADSSPEHKQAVIDFRKKKDAGLLFDPAEEERKTAVCRAIFEDLDSRLFDVVIPYAERLVTSPGLDVRSYNVVSDLTKSLAVYRYRVREKDDRGRVLATEKDFFDAKAIFDATEGHSDIKFTDAELRVLEALADLGFKASMSDLCRKTGLSKSRVDEILNGRGKGEQKRHGLMSKAPITREQESDSWTYDRDPDTGDFRRKTVTQFIYYLDPSFRLQGYKSLIKLETDNGGEVSGGFRKVSVVVSVDDNDNGKEVSGVSVEKTEEEDDNVLPLRGAVGRDGEDISSNTCPGKTTETTESPSPLAVRTTETSPETTETPRKPQEQKGDEDRAPTSEEAELLADVAGRLLLDWPGLSELKLWETTRDRLGRPISIATVRLWLAAEGYILSSERLNGSPLWNPPVGVIS